MKSKSSDASWHDYAYKRWYVNSGFFQLDQFVEPFLSKEALSKPEVGWLKAARLGLFLSTGEVARRLKISRAAYAAFEARERQGKITLNNLSKVAQAMDCELVYALRPKKRIRFSDLIWKKLTEGSSKHPLSDADSPRLKAHALLATVYQRMQDTEFRRRQKWTER